MKFDMQLLKPDADVRDQKPIKKLIAIVYHWVANPNTTAQQNRDFYNTRNDGKFGSAHYIIGLDGEVIQCIPDNERAFHCASDLIDPASGKVYTDLARSVFGTDVCSSTNSPNNYTIGIEMCHTDWDGTFTEKTLQSAKELGIHLCKTYNINPITNILTHNQIVGWKDCPKLWTTNPSLFEDFKVSISESIFPSSINSHYI